jgi:multidrug efflux pump subunit AcrA (membrane-fusion protein)
VDAARADYDSAKAALATAEANGLPEGSTAAIEAGAQLQTANKNLTLAEQRVADPAEADTVRAALERAAEAVAAARRAMAGVDTGPPADATGGA